jgi:hypothetical protein
MARQGCQFPLKRATYAETKVWESGRRKFLQLWTYWRPVGNVRCEDWMRETVGSNW